MFEKKRPTSFTINSRDPIPDPPGHEIKRELRPPPKVYSPYRDCCGYSPAKIQKMMEEKKKYEMECERIKTESDIARFEARLKGIRPEELPEVPVIPIPPPSVDYDVLRTFDPPSATRFYDVISPNVRPKSELKRKREARHIERNMAHGCPKCCPERYNSVKARTRPATRNGRQIQRENRPMTPNKRDELPLQMNQAYWNVLDETSVPVRPRTVYREHRKPVQFSKLRTGPRPGGIPICVNDLIESRARGQAKFEERMNKRRDRELFEREKTLHERTQTSRRLMNELQTRTRDIAAQSGQRWALYGTGSISESEKAANELKERYYMSAEDKEALEELNRIDERLRQERQAKKRPTEEMELLLEQSGIRRRKQ